VDGDELEVGERRGYDRRMPVGAVPEPTAEAMHEIGHVPGDGRAEDERAIGVGQAVLTGAILAGPQHRVDVVEHPAVDLADRLLVDREVGPLGDLVHEGERLPHREDFEGVLLAQPRRTHQNLLHLEVVEAVALDACGAVDRAHPGAVAEPFLVPRIEAEVAEQPAQPLEALDTLAELFLAQSVVHVCLLVEE
jgi:hypothetical protein